MKGNIFKGILLIVLSYVIVGLVYNNIYLIFSKKVSFEDDYFWKLLALYLEPNTAISYLESIFISEWWFYWLLIPSGIFGILLWGLQDFFNKNEKYEEADKYGIHGTAKWADPLSLMNGKTLAKASKSKYGKAEKTLGLPSGYILGRVPGQKKVIVMTDDTDVDNQHMLVIGSSGASKSQAFVIPNLINVRDKSIIVTDPKGELYNMTAQLKADQGYKVYQVDFVSFMQSRYNPLTYVETDLQAQTVANTIISNFEGDSGGDNAFFKNNATNMLSALIIYVKTEYPTEQANMATLVDVYTNHVQDEEQFEEWYKEIPKDHPAKKMLASILDLKGNTRASVTSTLNNGLSIFKLSKVQHMTAESDFNFEDFVNEKAILYVKLSMENDTFNPITSVFFSQMIDVLYDIAKQSPNETLPRKVLLLLDEFANIGKLNNYSKVMSTSRSLGLILCTIIQNKAQLEKSSMYGKEEAREIMYNHDVKIFLRADQADSDTTRWVSEAIGNTTVKQQKGSMTKSEKSVSRSENHEYVKRALMTPEEVGRLKKNESIIMIAGQDPIFAEKAFQFEIYPNLITDKDRKLNYNNLRKTLGFTGELIKEQEYVIADEISFSEYHNRKQKVKNESTNVDTQIKKDILGGMKQEYDKDVQAITNSLNEEEYTSQESKGFKSLFDEIQDDMKQHIEFSTYASVLNIKNIDSKEHKIYHENGLDKEAVRKKRNNTAELDDLENDLDI